MGNTGRWLGKPQVELVEDDKIKLLVPLRYIDPNNACWVAPKDALGDGASIPRVFWSLIGSPLTGTYRDASIIHDYYCSTRTRSWQSVHRVFYDAMITSGTSIALAKIMYAAVRLGGPKWTEMDSENVKVLQSQGLKLFTATTQFVELEDCSTGPAGPGSDGLQQIERKVHALAFKAEEQIVYSHPTSESDLEWAKERFGDDDLVNLDEIDSDVEAWIENRGNNYGVISAS